MASTNLLLYNENSAAYTLKITVVNRDEWSTFAPAFMQVVTAGPGNAPAQSIAGHVNELLPFSTATSVIDMGCGPGQMTDAVLQQYSTQLPAAARVIGVDNNPQMLTQYTKRKQMEIERGHAYWTLADTVESDIHDCAAFADNSVSHMLANFVVFLVPDPTKAVASLHRTLKPGGVLAISSWAHSEWQDLMYYPKKVRADLVMPTPPELWTAPDSVYAQLEKAGFRDIDVVQTDGYMPFTDHDEICRFILTKMPLSARVIAQMTDDEILQTHALMVADLKAKYPTTPAKMTGTATVAYCYK